MFFLSGIIAFLLACGAIWFWYLPKIEQQKESFSRPPNAVEVSESVSDSIAVSTHDSLK